MNPMGSSAWEYNRVDIRLCWGIYAEVSVCLLLFAIVFFPTSQFIANVLVGRLFVFRSGRGDAIVSFSSFIYGNHMCGRRIQHLSLYASDVCVVVCFSTAVVLIFCFKYLLVICRLYSYTLI